MTLTQKLARHAMEEHVDSAASVLERLDPDSIAPLLERGHVAGIAGVVERLSPHRVASVLGLFSPERTAEVLGALPADAATRALRRLDPARHEGVLALMDRRRARSIRTVLRFPPRSAGGLMDPDVLALPAELSAREALKRIREAPELSRYNLYVLDPQQRLSGALNLRELLLARGSVLLGNLMTRNPHRVTALADSATVLTHPGWKDVHALPVVDHADVFLGAIRYRVLRQLEEELLAPASGDIEASAAFAQIIAAGARGLLDAVSGAGAVDTRRTGHGAE